MKTYMMAQYSDLWWEQRRGIPTCSEFDKIITSAKGELSKSAQKYASLLVAEKRCLSPNFFTNRPITRAMAAGTETEPKARAWYAFHHDTRDVQQVGFVTNDSGTLGGSPDAVINMTADRTSCEGILELKCPQPDTHVGYLVDPEDLLADYRQQVHGHLVVSGCQWVELVSYCEGFEPVICRVVPDAYTIKLAEALAGFLKMLEATAAKVRGDS